MEDMDGERESREDLCSISVQTSIETKGNEGKKICMKTSIKKSWERRRGAPERMLKDFY